MELSLLYRRVPPSLCHLMMARFVFGKGKESVLLPEMDRYGSVMVWDGFNRQGKANLYVIHCALIGLGYQDEILRPPILPALGAFLVTMQSYRMTMYLNDLIQHQGILSLEWQASSPALAPAEHFWDVHGRRVAANHPPPVDVA